MKNIQTPSLANSLAVPQSKGSTEFDTRLAFLAKYTESVAFPEFAVANIHFTYDNIPLAVSASFRTVELEFDYISGKDYTELKKETKLIARALGFADFDFFIDHAKRITHMTFGSNVRYSRTGNTK